VNSTESKREQSGIIRGQIRGAWRSGAIIRGPLKNNGTTPDRIIGGSVDVADYFELHVTIMENGIARMRELSEIEIKPGETIEFKPGGSHAMFVNLRHPLSIGEHVKGTLIFEHAGKVQIEYSVEGIGAQMSPGNMMQMQH
jgi:copper(I)-binding protein